jgi:O-antigen ligase
MSRQDLAIAPLTPVQRVLDLLVALLAVAPGFLIAYNRTPSATLFNQLAAVVGWGLWVLILCEGAPRLALNRRVLPALAALGLIGLAMLASPWWTGLPLSLLWMNGGLLLAAILALLAGAGVAARGELRRGFNLLAWGLLIAGLLNVAVSLIQVFMPDVPNGNWIARSGLVGRSIGNMRQPNHLASLLMWTCIAAVYLLDAPRRWPRALAGLLGATLFACVFAVVLSASRTGMLAVAVLALWGLLDRKLAKSSRWALLATPLMLALSWGLMAWWASSGGHAFGAESRLAEGAGSPSRLAILANAWSLLMQHPLTGVGWGEFNLAWSMTPFPTRPIAFFDHTHDLPMQLLVELGLPLALLVMGLLVWAMWRAFDAGLKAQGREAVALRSAFMLVLMIGLHSLLEYPLWYAYFLLPTVFALGLCLGGREPQEQAAMSIPASLLQLTAVLLMAGSCLAVFDHRRIEVIYAPPEVAAPLAERIADGQHSVFFTTQADYAAATSLAPGQPALEATRRTAHNLIDVRLMMAWARSLHETGDDDRARYVVQRLKEFRNAQGQEWLAECDELPAGVAQPFQCGLPSRDYSYKEMR